MSINLRDDVLRAARAKPNKSYTPPASCCKKKCRLKCRVAHKTVKQTGPRPEDYDKSTCTVCGENLKDIYYLSKGELNKGISRGIEQTSEEGFLGLRVKVGSLVRCLSCGNSWLENIHYV